MSGNKLFDKLLEKSTSPLLLEPDWDSILKICDLIRQGDVQAKNAVSLVKKKLGHENIHVVSFSLQCLESMVKNCGSKVHLEVANKDFMELFKEVYETRPDPVKTKVLELIQCWSHAFKKNPNLKIVEDYYTALKFEGAKFPRLNESEAMFDVEEAPQWIHDSDANECLRCRVEFGPLRRRHHCRACGQIFCHACSSKQAPIPKYGIEKEVRVCDACYDKLMGVSVNNPASTSSSSSSQPSFGTPFGKMPKPDSTSNVPNLNPSRPPEKTEQEFEEELQLALALSESEAEAQKKQQQKLKQQYSSKSNSSSSSSLNITSKQGSKTSLGEAPPSAPYLVTEAGKSNKSQTKMPIVEKQPNNGIDPYLEGNNDETGPDDGEEDTEETRTNREITKFCSDLRQLLEIYVTRMKSDSARGRSITNDTAVQSLFIQLQHLHPRLLSYIKYKEDARAYYELLQDKLTQLKDAREALNALRQETFEKKRLEMEERERQRQLQIAHKLQLMRAQKQSYYMMQNQANLRRLQEQEQDLRSRLEQQRDMVMKREINTTSVPFMGPNNNQMMSMGNQPQLSMIGTNMMPLGPTVEMQMLESSLESLRLQQAYLLQQQQQQMGGNMPVNPVPQFQQQWQPQMQIPSQMGQPHQMMPPQAPPQQQLPQGYYDPKIQPQQQQSIPQQYIGYNQVQPPMAVPQAAPQPQHEQPKVAELISFD